MALVKENVAAVDISGEYAESGQVRRRDLLGLADGAPNFTMREFQLAAGAATPHHSHDWEHEVLILDVPSNEPHQFKNTGSTELRFICVVTNDGHLASISPDERDELVMRPAVC